MIKPIQYTLTVLAPAALLIFYIHMVAEMRDAAMAAAVPEEPVVETRLDPRFGLPIDPMTNLIMGDGYPTVKANCVKCHPTNLIIYFNQDRNGWLDAIRWMQAEKGVQQFTPGTEEILLNYLSKYYGP